ncbi:MAG: cytochrome c biogenesis protein DipZ [Actinobacteria bacterium]|nr:cytochrome c biogenesis protein DipZ [Actinomycetota bacterium]
MALLIVFGFLAGAGTALSPCVLPVLPIALGAGATGGRRRPLGIVVGLVGAFTFATVALVYVLDALGLPDTLLRTLAIVVLLAFGATLLVPPLAARVEGRLSAVAARLGARPAAARGDGFRSGLLVGGSLGLVYAPCAGPILAGVITVSASQPFTAGRLAVALSYGIGSALVLYVLMLGGRRLTAPLARRGGALQLATGALMVLVAVAMLNDYDLRFQSAIAKDLPGFLVTPTQGLEKTAAARRALADLRGGGSSRLAAAADATPVHAATGGRLGLRDFGAAPNFAETQRWFNTPGGRPLSMRALRGRVVLVDFWTYTCINCLRTLPYLKAWDARYRAQGLTIVGVHTPEFPFEKDAGNVAAAIAREGIRYPVVQDNDYGTWDAYGNQYWPAHYFVDARGHVRYAHFGEGDYGHSEQVIRALLAEAGRQVGAARADARGAAPSLGVTTPESYLGSLRAARFANGPILPGRQDFGAAPGPMQDGLSYGGVWEVGREDATAGPGATLQLAFGARRVFLVLGSPGRPRRMRVLLDGRPLPDRLAGADVHGGVATISAQRLYDLVDLPGVQSHRLELRPQEGVHGYAFTFG